MKNVIQNILCYFSIHLWGEWKLKDVSKQDTTGCVKDRKCQYCKTTQDKYIEAHTFGKVKKINSCIQAQECAVCGYQKKVKVEHDLKEIENEYGKLINSCKKCDFKNSIPGLALREAILVEDYEPDCNHDFETIVTVDGQGTSGEERCRKCGYTTGCWGAPHDYL